MSGVGSALAAGVEAVGADRAVLLLLVEPRPPSGFDAYCLGPGVMWVRATVFVIINGLLPEHERHEDPIATKYVKQQKKHAYGLPVINKSTEK